MQPNADHPSDAPTRAPAEPPGEIRHASTVALAGAGALITGPSGAGKSSLALALMAHGAGLVADDRTLLRRAPGGVLAAAPPGLPPLIEARGIGLLPVRLAPPVPVRLVVELGAGPQPRLPEPRQVDLLGHRVALIVAAQNAHLAHAVLQMLKSWADNDGG